MSNLEFSWPYAAILLLMLVPFYLIAGKRGDISGVLRSPVAPMLNQFLHGKKVRARGAFPWWLFFIWILLVLALMRPQLVGDAIEVKRDGRNLMMVLDISESMEATDMSVDNTESDRLTAAKEVMADFIDRRRSDRIGLIVFGSEAFLHSPLSFDHKTVKKFLDEAQIGFAGPKTAIGDALGLATKKLVEIAGDKVIILLTDGQNNMGALEPTQAAKIAQKQGIKIYIVGIGASRMVVDGFFGPTAVNPSLSLDEAEPELKEIAASTGGKYFRAKEFKTLTTIYSDIDALEPVKSDPLIFIPKKELFFWPLACVMLAFALRMLIAYARGQSRRRA